MKIVLRDFKQDKKFGGKAYLIDFVTRKEIFTIMLTNEEYFKEIPFESINVGEEIRVGMSGCIDYSSGAHQTMSGKWQFPKIFYIEAKENISDNYDPFEIKYETKLDTYNKVKFVKMLNENIKDILLLIEKKGYMVDYGDMSPYYDIFPLIKTYRKEKLFNLPYEAEIYWKRDSFEANFYWDKISIPVPKAKPYYIELYNHVQVEVGKTKIYYSVKDKRKIVYKTVYKDNLVIGYEQYKDITHAPAMIEIDHNLWSDELFDWRLGDISAIPLNINEYVRDELANEDTINYLMKNRRRVTEEHLKKVKVLSGNLIEKDGYLYLEKTADLPIVLYHPEHGLLELERDKYILLEPNYIHKGHD